jgi:hypothetical protein
MIFQAVLVLRDKVVGVPPMRQEEWSVVQYRFLRALRLFGGIGLMTIWISLIYVTIDVGVWHWMEPWHTGPQGWALAYCLIYTCFALNLMRPATWISSQKYWRLSSRLRFQALFIIGFFIIALASIADLYFPPPMGSRQTGVLKPALSVLPSIAPIARMSWIDRYVP